MADQIFIGREYRGQNNYKEAFNIDNESFQYLYNAYAWRGRIKRKRGTSLLGQLQRQITMASVPSNWQYNAITLSSGSGNLITGLSLESTSSISPGTLSLTVGVNTYADTNRDGTLVGTPAGTGTINYATGDFSISGGGSSTVTGTFSYYPGLPVMGLRDFVSGSSQTYQYPVPIAFDTSYSYQLDQTSANNIFFYNTTFYKTTQTPFTWQGADYQQFWTTNYANALWVTNGNPGFHFQAINLITVGNPTTITTSTNHNLVTGDIVWFNEIQGTAASLLNNKTFSVTVTGNTTFTVAVDTTALTVTTTGIFQKLTASVSGQDGIRWYDGDPTVDGVPSSTGKGWVNFAPPLTATSISILGYNSALYYLVGALAILPFKDRLLFFSPYIQSSSGSPIQLYDTVLWSWNGTPYYANAPSNQTSDFTAYYVDTAGKGGYLSAGISQPINTISNNEDILLIGFGGNGRKTRFVYTANEIQPFLFFTINSEYPSSATFSSIPLDKGAIDIGPYGVSLTDQQSSQRIDLEIPSEILQIQALNNGIQRVCAIRDFLNEWIYFTYPLNISQWKFPTQTLMYNYRDVTWSVLYENYTTYGRYRQQTKNTWVSIGRKFGTWNAWRQPWNSASSSALYANIIAGNPQGYVIIKDQGTSESVSGTIKAIADNGSGQTRITSYNHCVSSQNPFFEAEDYLYFTGCIGNTFLNNTIGKVVKVIDANTFDVDIEYVAGTYEGLGKFARLSQPWIQTKQFNFYWDQGRKTRLGVQKYLLDRTQDGQCTVNIYLNEDSNNNWNTDPILPDNTQNSALIYTQTLFTCPETNNLQMPTSSKQSQIWHRMNTSMIGDTVQIGITLSESQMKVYNYATAELGLHGIQLTIYPGPLLS